MQNNAEARVGDRPQSEHHHQHRDAGDVVICRGTDDQPLQPGDAELAAREIREGEQEAESDEREGERRERKVRAAQAQAEVAGEIAKQRGDRGAGPDRQPRRDAELEREQRRGVGAGAEEKRVAEVHLSRIAGEQVPARGEDGEDAGHGEDAQHIRVAIDERQQQQAGGPDENQRARRQHQHFVRHLGPCASQEVHQRSSSNATPNNPSGRASSPTTMMPSAATPLRCAPSGRVNTVTAST